MLRRILFVFVCASIAFSGEAFARCGSCHRRVFNRTPVRNVVKKTVKTVNKVRRTCSGSGCSVN